MDSTYFIFTKDLDNALIVHKGGKTVKFEIDGHQVELDQWKIQALIQILVDFDKKGR